MKNFEDSHLLVPSISKDARILAFFVSEIKMHVILSIYKTNWRIRINVALLNTNYKLNSYINIFAVFKTVFYSNTTVRGKASVLYSTF